MGIEDVDEKIEWEARRVAAAFGVKEWGTFGLGGEIEVSDGWYSGNEPLLGFALTWSIDRGVLREVSVYDEKEERSLAVLKLFRYHNGPFSRWRLQVHEEGSALMARGLYRLGFEDEGVLSQLPALSAHEKMELRLSLPREFWPENWREEEEQKSACI